jgi:FtsZ-interacting cell division protein YlmF
MNLFGTVRRIWAHGDDEEEENDRDFIDAENEDLDPDYDRGGSASHYSGYGSDSSYDTPSYSSNSSSKYASSAYPAGRSGYSPLPVNPSVPSSGSAAGSGASGRMRSVNPTLRAREKNIYTIKPKRLDEATVAADCLKTGSAVIVNLEAVDRVTAVRIVDFMSGVCYGIDGAQGQPGHAMKLGEMIFLFTPAEFEITSDETDYAANSEHFFREMTDAQAAPSSAPPHIAPPASVPPASVPPATPPAGGASGSSFASSYNSPNYSAERRPWE